MQLNLRLNNFLLYYLTMLTSYLQQDQEVFQCLILEHKLHQKLVSGQTAYYEVDMLLKLIANHLHRTKLERKWFW